MVAVFDSGGSSKRWRTDELWEQTQTDATAAAVAVREEEDRISALPEDLRLHILGLLPLKSAIAECEGLTNFSLGEASSLQSFHYSGAYIGAYTIPATCALADLYICFGGPVGRQRWSMGTTIWFASPSELRRNWLEALTNLSNLTVLTLCSSALRRVSAKARARFIAGNATTCILQNLRELQLLMFAMCNENSEIHDNMGDIYVFLVACCTPQLERLFVQLPTRSNQYKPELEPSESDEEIPQDDVPVEELSEEEASEEDELEEELSEEEAPEEDQSEEDGSEEELSDGGQSEEETLEDGFQNLVLLKMMNFMGRHNEMQLITHVLKKSTSLNQLILFTPKNDLPEGLQKDHLNTSHFLETKLLPLEKASPIA